MTQLISPEDFDALAYPSKFGVFRLETLPIYTGSGEDEWIAAFNAGAAEPPPDPQQDAWEARIRAHRATGRTMQRVHVVTEPLSSYLQYELTWGYAGNVAAGEDVRIAAVDTWPHGVPRFDFWLMDSSVMFQQHYDADGLWLGAELVEDPARVVAACRARDAALYHAVSWWEYIRERPQLLARVPAVHRFSTAAA